jgi:hypothetical protein
MMTTFTETDFEQLFKSSEEFDEWLKTEFLEVRREGPEPGVWLDVASIERMPQLSRAEKDIYLRQHPHHDLSAPVLPFPFAIEDLVALMDSDCFRHSSARWPDDEAVERAQTINPRTKTLMMELLGHMVPGSQVERLAPARTQPAGMAEALPASVAAAPARQRAARLTWQDATGAYIIAKLRAETANSAKSLYRILEHDTGNPESPFDSGTGAHRGSLVVRKTGRPLSLKTLQNSWQDLRERAAAG